LKVLESAAIRANWEMRGFSFEIWSDPPGQVWSDFVHETDELAMLLEGRIEFSFAGKTFRPEIGREVLIPAGERHSVANVGAIRNRWCFGYRLRR
jgi:mannose-6-phosphate isomerase-like protein (cupin superfamily)